MVKPDWLLLIFSKMFLRENVQLQENECVERPEPFVRMTSIRK